MDYRSVRIQDIINSGNIQNSLNRIIEMNDNRKDLKMLDDRTVITPDFIVTDMINLVKNHNKNIFNPKSRFLIINPKNGEFIVQIFQNLMKSEDMIKFEKDETKRAWYILKNQIYILCTDKTIAIMLGTLLYGDSGLASKHITWTISNKDLDKLNENQLKGYVLKRFKETAESIEHKEQETYMKFDVVIGNPPYNNDVYLDFVTLGHKLLKEDGVECMITPAKWQAKTDGKPKGSSTPDKNEEFRKNIVPYMQNIIFYPDSRDIFDIGEHGGISYYTINKEKQPEKKVTIKCKNNNFESESEIHDEINTTLLNRTVLSIIGKVGTLGGGFKQSLYVKNTDHGEETIDGTLGFKRQTFVNEQDRGEALKKLGYVEVMQGEKVCGYKKISELYTTEKIDKYKIITSILVSGGSSYMNERGEFSRYFNSYIIGPNQVPKGSFPVIRYFNTLDEAKSFNSYCNTKIFQFLFCIGVCGTTLTKEFFRFIPDPGKFDHIFTDQELYEKYNLTDEEIKIIESVIKERK